MTGGNAELARRGYEALARGDLDVIRELLAPDVLWHGGDPDWKGACHSREEAVTFMTRARKRGPLPELVDVVEAGDQVIVVLQPPDGGLRANLTTIRDGQVVEMVGFESPEAAQAAAGR